MTQALTPEQEIMLKRYESLAEMGLTNQQLAFEKRVSLFRDISLSVAGYLANLCREAVSNHKVFGIRNQVINNSNICINQCNSALFTGNGTQTGPIPLYWRILKKKHRTISMNQSARFM
jgi:hypothetical protein